MNLPPACSARPLSLAPLLAAIFLAALAGCREKAPAAPAASPSSASYIAYARGQVDLPDGLVRLAAGREGPVRKVLVADGDTVHADQVLAVIDDQSARLALAVAAATLAETRAALPSLQLRLASARRDSARLAPLVSLDAAPAAEADQAGDLVSRLQAELAAAEAAANTAETRVQAATGEVEAHTVRAPSDGLIVQCAAHPGEAPGSAALFLFAPAIPRIVRAELDERFADKVTPGQSAEVVVDEGEDHERVLPARVVRIGGAFGSRLSPGEPGEEADLRTTDCIVTLADQNLRFGRRVLVRIKP